MEPDEAVRKRILKTSLRLFFTRGFSRVTTQEIAGALGISKKTLYQYFSSKDEIVLVALSANLEGVGRHIDEVLEDDTRSFDSKFTGVLSVLSVQIGSINLVFMEDIHKYLPEGWELIDTFRRERILGKIGALLREGQREGYLRDSLDMDMVIFLLFSIITQVLRPEYLLRQGRSLHSIFSSFIDLIYGGLLVPERYEELNHPMKPDNLEELHGKEGIFIE
jgi:AcrR family transcriptional regulator